MVCGFFIKSHLICYKKIGTRHSRKLIVWYDIHAHVEKKADLGESVVHPHDGGDRGEKTKQMVYRVF